MNPAMASVSQSTAKQTIDCFRPVPPTAPCLVKLIIVAAIGTCGSPANAQMPEGLVRNVAEAGSRLVAERDHYTYTQTFKFHEIRKGASVGRYEEIRDITFTGTGERVERHRKKPVLSLRRIRMTPEDFRDLRDVNPFVLTMETLSFYRVRYKGTEPVDGDECHILQLRPRQILYGQRFFEGLVWIGVEHGQVGRAAGRPVPQIHRMEGSNLFPAFETRYEPVDGGHWFPTRTEGDDILPFPSGNQRVRLLIEYTGYKRFTASSTVTFGDPTERQGPPEDPQ